MLADKTVLILGAGASIEYGLPTGKELLDRIYQRCLNPHTIASFAQLLEACEIDRSTAIGLAELIENVPALSIDLLLQYRNEFIDVGKTAIAHELLPVERPHKLNDLRARATLWYPYLF